MICPSVSCCTLLCAVIYYSALPYSLLCHALHCTTLLFFAVFCRVLPCPDLPYPDLPGPTLPCSSLQERWTCKASGSRTSGIRRHLGGTIPKSASTRRPWWCVPACLCDKPSSSEYHYTYLVHMKRTVYHYFIILCIFARCILTWWKCVSCEVGGLVFCYSEKCRSYVVHRCNDKNSTKHTQCCTILQLRECLRFFLLQTFGNTPPSLGGLAIIALLDKKNTQH